MKLAPIFAVMATLLMVGGCGGSGAGASDEDRLGRHQLGDRIDDAMGNDSSGRSYYADDPSAPRRSPMAQDRNP